MVTIYKISIPGLVRVEPHQLSDTAHVGARWENAGRVEFPTGDSRFGRVYGHFDGIEHLNPDQVDILVGLIDTSPGDAESHGTRAVVYRLPFYVRMGDRDRHTIIDFTLDNFRHPVTGGKQIPGYRVGKIVEGSYASWLTPKDCFACVQGKDRLGSSGERFLGCVSPEGNAFVQPSDMSRMPFVQCGYVSPPIDLALMAGAIMLQVFGLD